MKSAISNDIYLEDLDAVKALTEDSLSDQQIAMDAETSNCYMYFENATSEYGDFQPDDASGDTGWWQKEGLTLSSLVYFVEDNYDFEGNNATDVTSIYPPEEGQGDSPKGLVIFPPTLTSNQWDYTPDSWTECCQAHIKSNSSSRRIYSFGTGSPWQEIDLWNIGTRKIILYDNRYSSIANKAGRMLMAGSSYKLNPGCKVTIQFDPVAVGWRVDAYKGSGGDDDD